MKLKPTLDEMRKNKIELVDLLPSETMVLKQVSALRSEIDEARLKDWFATKSFPMPTLAACLQFQ